MNIFMSRRMMLMFLMAITASFLLYTLSEGL